MNLNPFRTERVSVHKAFGPGEDAPMREVTRIRTWWMRRKRITTYEITCSDCPWRLSVSAPLMATNIAMRHRCKPASAPQTVVDRSSRRTPYRTNPTKIPGLSGDGRRWE